MESQGGTWTTTTPLDDGSARLRSGIGKIPTLSGVRVSLSADGSSRCVRPIREEIPSAPAFRIPSLSLPTILGPYARTCYSRSLEGSKNNCKAQPQLCTEVCPRAACRRTHHRICLVSPLSHLPPLRCPTHGMLFRHLELVARALDVIESVRPQVQR